MDYEKAYKEALGRAKSFRTPDNKDVAAYIFPVLKGKENITNQDCNYKTYTELVKRLEKVKDAVKKQNYGIAMDILCKPYPEYQITTSTELKDSELTWEDMMAIDDLLDELLPPRRDSDELVLKGYYEEVLKRFKERKGK